MRYINRRLLGLMALISVMLTSFPSRSVWASPEQCFHQTGYCIVGRFYQYWQANGGLAVFGYPINAAHPEHNPDTGETYLTQWFERNRFELHPENTPPFDVLLGRLGDDRLRQDGRDWQAAPAAQPQAGCMWFAQTEHNVCDQANGRGFSSYWSTHGLQLPKLDAHRRSIALFGFPLTEATMEVSPTDGKTYLTQWFERARMEWHPNEPDQYKVLLGLLGNEVQNHPTARRLKYFWPTVTPQQMVVQRAESGATETAYNLQLTQPDGQFFATVTGGVGSEAPQRAGGTSVIVRGVRGVAYTTGAGYSLFWTENGRPYAIRGGLPLPDAMRLAEGLEALDRQTWNERLTANPK